LRDGPLHLQDVIDLGQLDQALDVRGVALHHLLQQGRGLLSLLPLQQPVHGGEQLGIGEVELLLQEVHPTHLDPGVLVGRVDLQEALEEGLRLLDLPGLDVGLAQARQQRHIVRRLLDRLLQVVGGPIVVLLNHVDPGQLLPQAGAPGVDLEPLLQHLQGFGQMALLAELQGNRDVLLDRLGAAALPGVDVGQLAPDLEVARVQLRHLLQDLGGVLGLAPLQVLVDHDLVLALGLHHEALLGIELGQLQIGIEDGRVELVDLLPHGDGTDQESVLRVEVGDLGVLLGSLAGAVDLGVEVPDLVDGVPVAGVLLDDLAIESDRLIEAARLLEAFGVLLQFDRVDSLGHSTLEPSPMLEQPPLACPPEGAAMDGRRTQRPNRFPMAGAAVPHVTRQTVAWKAAVPFPHQRVARHLGHDGGGGYGHRLSIAFHDPPLRQPEARDLESIHQQEVGNYGQAQDGSTQSEVGGLEDVDPVDLLHLGRPHRDGSGLAADAFRQRLPLARRQALGIVDAGAVEALGQNHGAGQDRPAQGPPPHLIGPGHGAKAQSPSLRFESEATSKLLTLVRQGSTTPLAGPGFHPQASSSCPERRAAASPGWRPP
jgi:hypothetical protein